MKWKNITWKQKKYLVWLGSVIVLYLVYQKNISNTILLARQCSQLEDKLHESESAEKRMRELKAELTALNRVSGKPMASEQIQQGILDKAAELSVHENLVLSSFNEPHSVTANGYEVTSHMLEIEGGFIPAVRFLYAFENDFKNARLVSVRFYINEDYKTHKKYLYGTLYFQHLRKV
jgi:hypothetical protein